MLRLGFGLVLVLCCGSPLSAEGYCCVFAERIIADGDVLAVEMRGMDTFRALVRFERQMWVCTIDTREAKAEPTLEIYCIGLSGNERALE